MYRILSNGIGSFSAPQVGVLADLCRGTSTAQVSEYRDLWHRTKLTHFILIASLLLAPFAKKSLAQAPADDGSAAILPFLDDGTFIVARLDVEKVDPKALEQFMTGVTETMLKQGNPPAEQQERQKQDMRRAYEHSAKWLADMKDAGAKQVYFLLLNSGDLREREDDPVVVVPLTDGADADRITPLLKESFGRRSEGETLNNAIIFGKPNAMTRLKSHVQANLPPGVEAADLAAALAGGGPDTPLRIAVIPGESTRAWIEENLPELPPQIGGGDTKTLSRGLKWASIAIHQKDKLTATITIRGADAPQAKSLHGLMQKSFEFAKKQLAAAPNGEETVKQIESLKPTLKNDSISLKADPVELFTGFRLVGQATRPRAVTPAVPPPAAKPDDGGL